MKLLRSAKEAIWRAYLLHKKSNFKSFQVGALRAAYVTAVKSLVMWRDRAPDPRAALDAVRERKRERVCVCMCVCVRERVPCLYVW